MQWLKKILLTVVLILFLAVVGLWAVGQRSDRGHFNISILIDRPITDVYNALINPDMTKKWVSGLVEIKRLTPGDTHVGTKLVLVEHVDRLLVTMEEEITDLQPPHLVKYTTIGQGEPSTRFTEYGQYQLKEVDGMTQFTLDSQIEYHGFLYRLIEPLLTYTVRDKFEGDQITLKRLLEDKQANSK